MVEDTIIQIPPSENKASQCMYYDSLVTEVNELMSAIELLNYNKVKSIVELSRDSGRLVNCSCGSLQLTPLLFAAALINNQQKNLIFTLLLDHGARVDVSDIYGRTALHYAASMGSDTEVRMLLGKGADPNTRCTQKVQQDDKMSENVPFAKDVILLPEKFDRPKVWGRTPLHRSVIMNQELCCQLLLEYKATVNTLDDDECSPLLLAGTTIPVPVDSTVQLQRYESIVELLVKHGADVNATPKEDAYSSLFLSARIGSVKATSVLLEAGAKLDSPFCHQKTGKNILHMAVESGRPAIIKHLISHQNNLKIYINIADKEGNTPLHLAAFLGNVDCLKVLINRGGDLSTETVEGLSVIYAIYQHVPRPTEFLSELLDSKIIGLQQQSEKHDKTILVELDFRMLAPRNNNRQMSVVSLLTAEQSLIQHPLIEAFIHVKWRKMRWLFFVIFSLQVCFVVSLSIFTLIIVNPDWFREMKETGLIVRKLTRALLFLSSLVLNLHNFMELRLMGAWVHQMTETSVNSICYYYGLIMVYFVESSDIYTGNRMTILTHIASIVIVTAWGSLMFQMGRFPSWGYYGLMFSAVLKNVFKVMSTGICLFIGFVLCFWIQFPSKFRGIWNPFMKVLIMMTGELNDEFFFTYDSKNELQCSRLVFVVFIVLASIVLTNLMLGLAVNDVQALQQEGYVTQLIKQTEFIIHLERLSTMRILQRRFIPSKLRDLLSFKHRVPTKLFVKDPASAHACNALPDRIMDGIVAIARAKIINDKSGRNATITLTDTDSTSSSDVNMESGHSNESKSQPNQSQSLDSVEVLKMFKEIKQMLVSLKQNDTVYRSNTLPREDMHSALLRKLSRVKRR